MATSNIQSSSASDIDKVIAECLAAMGSEYQELMQDLNGINHDETQIAKDQEKINAKTEVRDTHHVTDPDGKTRIVYTYHMTNQYSATQIQQLKDDIQIREGNKSEMEQLFQKGSGDLERISAAIAELIASKSGAEKEGEGKDLLADLNLAIQNLRQIYKAMDRDSLELTSAVRISHTQPALEAASFSHDSGVIAEEVVATPSSDRVASHAYKSAALQPSPWIGKTPGAYLKILVSESADVAVSTQSTASAISPASHRDGSEQAAPFHTHLVTELEITAQQFSSLLTSDQPVKNVSTLFPIAYDVKEPVRISVPVPQEELSVEKAVNFSSLPTAIAAPVLDTAWRSALTHAKAAVLEGIGNSREHSDSKAAVAPLSEIQNKRSEEPKKVTAPREAPVAISSEERPLSLQAPISAVDQAVEVAVQKTLILTLPQADFHPAVSASLAVLAAHDAVVTVAQQISVQKIDAFLPGASKQIGVIAANQAVARALDLPLAQVEAISTEKGWQPILESVKNPTPQLPANSENPVVVTDGLQQFISILDEVIGSGNFSQIVAESASSFNRNIGSLQSPVTEAQIGAAAQALAKETTIREVGDGPSRGAVNSLSAEIVKERKDKIEKKGESSQESDGSEVHLKASEYHQILAV